MYSLATDVSHFAGMHGHKREYLSVKLCNYYYIECFSWDDAIASVCTDNVNKQVVGGAG